MAQPYIGAPIRRREDIRFITGAGTYVDDIKLPHMVHAAILRSPTPTPASSTSTRNAPRPCPGWFWSSP